MISFLIGESGFGPSRLPANGSGGDGHVSFFCSRMELVRSSKADRFFMGDPLGTAAALPNRDCDSPEGKPEN
jgi:hypothetical protein